MIAAYLAGAISTRKGRIGGRGNGRDRLFKTGGCMPEGGRGGFPRDRRTIAAFLAGAIITRGEEQGRGKGRVLFRACGAKAKGMEGREGMGRESIMNYHNGSNYPARAATSQKGRGPLDPDPPSRNTLPLPSPLDPPRDALPPSPPAAGDRNGAQGIAANFTVKKSII